MNTPTTHKFNGKVYYLAVSHASKETAQKEAGKLRKGGLQARLYRRTKGIYSVYSRHI